MHSRESRTAYITFIKHVLSSPLNRVRYSSYSRDETGGFLLPAVILISLGIMIAGLTLMQVISNNSNSFNQQYYQLLAKEAAQAGVTQANACIDAGSASWTTLTPGYDCAGLRIGNSPLYVAKLDNWESTYTVTKSGDDIQVAGSVRLSGLAGVTTQQFSETLKTSVINSVTSSVAVQGNNKTVTAVTTGGEFVCAISSGEAYCWGRNVNGQLGNGNTTQQSRPTKVRANPNDELYGKTVTAIRAGADHVCVIAENNPVTANNNVYCWGLNGSGQLGNGSTTTSSVPVKVTGSGIENQRVIRLNTGTNTPGAVTCALTNETTPIASTSTNAYCWGNNSNGQLGVNAVGGTRTSPARVTDPLNVLAGRQLKEIASGHVHTCAVTNDSLGQVYCWGNNNTLGGSTGVFGIGSTSNFNQAYPQTPVPAASLGNQPATNIAAGSWNTCAIAGTRVYCWGNNGRGQLGNGTTTTTSSPVAANADPVTGETNTGATDVDIDSDFTCAVFNSKAKCWGENTDDNTDGITGQLGFGIAGSYANSPLTVKAPVEGKAATAVSTGYQHGCAIANGSLFCWGKNSLGQLGTNNTVSTNTPIAPIDSQLNTSSTDIATAVSAGADHTCAIIGSSAYCWGSNTYGQLGNVDAVDQNEPTLVGGLLTGKTITKIAAGDRFSCAATDTYQIYCWGRNTYGQLGNNSSGSNSFTPVAVSMPVGSGVITALSAGTDFTCAVINVNVGVSPNLPEYCWGLNSSKQLGDNTTTNRLVPTRIPNSAAMSRIATGSTYGCAVQSTDGFLYCWGTNGTNGMLGNNGPAATQYAPTRISTGTISTNNISGITNGTNVACAILNNTARSVCWGLGTSMQLANNPTATSRIPVNSYSTGSMTNKTVSIMSSGNDHTCAVTGDNSLICWGLGTNGRLGNGSTSNSNPVTINSSGAISGKSLSAVSAGASHTCAIADGLVYCWGNHLNGRLGLGNGINSNVTSPSQVQRYVTGPPSTNVTTPSGVAY